MVLEITNENFDESILKSKGLVMVDCWATWCGPCRQLTQVIDKLEENNRDKMVTITKLNVDVASDSAVSLRVRSIPCVIFFKDGVEIVGGRIVGLNKIDVYQKSIDDLI